MGVAVVTGIGQRQLAVRVDDETLVSIDKKRMELAEQTGEIPTRSEVVRIALDAYLKTSGASGKGLSGK